LNTETITERVRPAPAGSNTPQARDRRYVWHPWSPVNAGPRPMIVSGRGCLVRDVSGNEYIDAGSLNSTCGYAHPFVVAAARRQLETMHGIDMSASGQVMAGALAERIAAHLPASLSRTLFVNSGSEGNEAALMIAAGYSALTGQARSRVVTFALGYHGSTVLTRSLSGLPPTSHYFQSPVSVTRVELPAPARDMRSAESLGPLLAAFAAAIGDDPADLPVAVVVEPFINVGGGVVLPAGFLRGLRDLCDATGTLLIIDEVFTGYGRTGAMFGFQHEGIEPDIIVSSKGLSGGYAPIAAVTAQQRIFQAFARDPIMGGLRYGHTTSGHAVACAVAAATIEVIENENLLARSRDLGARLLGMLEPLAGRGGVTDVRGRGLLVILELATDEAAAALIRTAARHGLLVRQHGQGVMVVPPLIVDEPCLEQVVARITAAVDEGSPA